MHTFFFLAVRILRSTLLTNSKIGNRLLLTIGTVLYITSSALAHFIVNGSSYLLSASLLEYYLSIQFLAVLGLLCSTTFSLIVESEGYCLVQCTDFSWQFLLLLGSRASVVAAPGL